MIPVIMMVGVDLMFLPWDWLYRDTFPATMGREKRLQKSPIALTDDTSSPITSGSSGLPKFRESTTAWGLKPAEMRFLYASHMVCNVPSMDQC